MDSDELRSRMIAQDLLERSPRDPPSDRYRRDPMFHALVDQMRAFIRAAQYTPSELREAAILAAIIEEMHRPVSPFVERRRECGQCHMMQPIIGDGLACGHRG